MNDKSSECTICYCEGKIIPTEDIPHPNNICRHWSIICGDCKNSLKKTNCPFCDQDWSAQLGKKSLNPIWCAIYFLIACFDDDTLLLEHILEKRGFDPSAVYPYHEACKILTGCLEEKEASTIWCSLEDREFMKKTFLLCQGIEWKPDQQKYISL